MATILISLHEAAARGGVDPELLKRFVSFGLIEPLYESTAEIYFALDTIPRIRIIEHLRLDLGVNLAGIGDTLKLLDRLSAIRHRESAGRKG